MAQAGEDDLPQSMQQVSLSLSGSPPGYWQEAQEMMRLARRQDVNTTNMFEHWIGYMGLKDALDIIIFLLLRLISELWHQGGINLRGEQSVIWNGRPHLMNFLREDAPAGETHAFIACGPGDFHEIGALTASVFLRRMGWQSISPGSMDQSSFTHWPS